MKATFTFPNIEICVERPGAVQTNLASAPLDPFIRTRCDSTGGRQGYSSAQFRQEYDEHRSISASK